MNALAVLALLSGLLRPCEPHRVHFLGHAVQAFAVSPDGALFAISRDTNWIDVHDAATGKVKHTVRMSDGDRVVILAFSPDGRLLAGGAWYNPTVRVWSTATGTEEWITSPATKTGGGETRGMAFSPDGKLLAVGQTDGVVRLLDAASGKVLRSFDERAGRDGFVTGVAFHPSGKAFAAVSSYDKRGHVWAADGSEAAVAFEGHEVAHGAEGHSVLFTKDGRTVIVPGDRELVLIEAATGGVRERLTTPCQSLSAIALSPDGRFAAGVDAFGPRAVVVDLVTRKVVKVLRWAFGRALGVKSAGGRLFVAGFEGSVRVFDWPKTGPPKWGPPAAKDRELIWDMLNGDPKFAHLSIGGLAKDPAWTMPRIRDALKPAMRPKEEMQRHIASLVRQLGEDDFDRREAAFRELVKLAPRLGTEVLRAGRAATDPDVKWRLSRVRETVGGADGSLSVKAVRCLELLERIGTAEAREVVAAVAKGDPDAALTRDAKDTLARMEASLRIGGTPGSR